MNHSPQEARALHDTVAVTDLHADTPLLMRRGYDFLSRHKPWLQNGALFGHVDLPRMKEAGMTAQMFGLVTLPKLQWSLMKEAEKQLDCVYDVEKRAAGAVRIVAQASEVEQARKDGVTAVLLSLEGIQAVDAAKDRPGHDSVVDALQSLCNRGVRSVGLVHFTRNVAGTPGWAYGDGESGLTSTGRAVVEALTAMGCLVDLAHLNHRGFLDAAEQSKNPCVVSHTGLKHFSKVGRNIDDDQIKAVADRGGVIGIMYSRQFLGASEMERVVEEFKHLQKIGGDDVLALGSDFDGFVVPPKGLTDVTSLTTLTAALWDALGENATKKLLGENMMRVLRAVPLKAGKWASVAA